MNFYCNTECSTENYTTKSGEKQRGGRRGKTVVQISSEAYFRKNIERECGKSKNIHSACFNNRFFFVPFNRIHSSKNKKAKYKPDTQKTGRNKYIAASQNIFYRSANENESNRT